MILGQEYGEEAVKELATELPALAPATSKNMLLAELLDAGVK